MAAHSPSSPTEDTQLKAPALLGQVALLQEQDAKYYQRQCTYRCLPLLPLWKSLSPAPRLTEARIPAFS